MAKYIKLGTHATSYSDSLSGVSIAGPQVVEMPSNVDPNLLKNFNRAMGDGHITTASEEDFANWQKILEEGQKRAEVEHEKLLARQKALKAQEGGVNKIDRGPTKDVVEPPEEDQNTEDDDDEEPSKSDMIDALKSNPLVTEDQKKNLAKLDEPKLRKLYEMFKAKK